MMRNTLLTSLTLALALPLSAQTIIIADDFDSADSTDLNAGIARQTGTAATQNWNKIGSSGVNNTAIIGNQLLVGGSSTTIDYSTELGYNFGSNAALVANGAFVISFDIVSVASGSYTAFALSSLSERTRPAVDASTQFGLLFIESSDTISVREGTAATSSATGLTDLTGTVVLTVTTASITNGTDFTIGMTLAGNTIDLNGANPGTDFSSTWDNSDLYMSLGSRNGSSTFDAFSVAAIPEPSTVALIFGGVCTVLLTLRRKKAS